MVIRKNHIHIHLHTKCLVILVSLLLLSCNNVVEPEIKGIKNVYVSNIKDNNLVVNAELVYFNPNQIGGKIKSIDIAVTANQIAIGKATQSGESDVSSNSEFHIPLTFTVPLNKVFQNELGLFTGILGALVNREINIRFIGETEIDILGIPFITPVDYGETLRL